MYSKIIIRVMLIIVSMLLVFIGGYFITSFIMQTTDTSEWSLDARAIYVIASLLVGLLFYAGFEQFLDETGRK